MSATLIPPTRPMKILLIEDSLMDTNLVQIALSRSPFNSQLAAFSDAEKAMLYLRHNIHSKDRPDLIILDLYLIGKDGGEVLIECKTNEDLKAIPIIVFTSTALADEIGLCYELGADKVVTKPGELEPFLGVVQSFEDSLWKKMNFGEGLKGISDGESKL